MKHLGTVTLETERLILRRFTLDDADVAFRNWTSDSEVTKFLCWPTHTDVDVTKRVLSDWVSRYDRPDYYQWAIVLKESGEPIGSIAVVEMNEPTEQVEIGYCIGCPWWHRGIVAEALQALIAFFFEQVHVGRISARHDPANPNSGAVMRKCGMKHEGTLRRADRNNRGIVDVCIYGLLADEYFSNK